MFGTRDLDPGEGPALTRSGIVRLSAEASPAAIDAALQAVAGTMEKFYVHLDMDALDPSEGRANGYTARGGFTNEKLQALLAAVAGNLPVQALTIASYDPAYDNEGTVVSGVTQPA